MGEQTFDPLADAVVMQTEWNDVAQVGYDLRLIQFDGPIQESWVHALVDAGLTPIQYIHPYIWQVKGNPFL